MTLKEFAKLNFLEKVTELNCSGVLEDKYTDNRSEVYVYSLADFFVEVNESPGQEGNFDITPFTHNSAMRINQSAIKKTKLKTKKEHRPNNGVPIIGLL